MVLYKQPVSCFIMLLFFSIWPPEALSQEYSTAPVPSWARPIQIPSSEVEERHNHNNGVAHLLLDQQWRLGNREQSRYTHYASMALNTSGVEEISQITVNFNPSYETLTLHQVQVHREGVSIDKLSSAQINLIQRERELEYRIYDGSETLNIILEDVRAGDTVEYSYSIDGANPILSGHFAQRLDLRWQVPLAQYHYRVLCPKERHLFIRNHQTDKQPEERVSATHIEYIWQQSSVDELRKDPNVPSWYDAFPHVYLSDFAGWTEVGNWALPLYKPITTTPALQEVVKSITSTADSNEERILAALQFVQSEVRYLGIETGVRSHKPSTPDTVLRQRFGDCKDKSRLLTSLLQGMGIEAYPALVNTFSGKMVIGALPTPKRFNHVIVKVLHQGNTYWLDPTRQYQHGNLEALYQPDYKYALVITGNDSKLEPMFSTRKKRYNSKVVEEVLDISGEGNKPATYRIRNQFFRYYADNMREVLSETSLDELQQSYLNFTARYYPDVKVDKPIDLIDDQRANRITLTEQYTIPNIWRPSEQEGMEEVEFVSFLMLEALKFVKNPKRTMPYAIDHPVAYRQISKIKVPENSFFDDEFVEIKAWGFYFSKKITFKDDILKIECKYISTDDHVHPKDIQNYASDLEKAFELLQYTIVKNDNIDKNNISTRKLENLNWIFIISYISIFILTFIIIWKYIYKYDPVYQHIEILNNIPTGIGGWLIVPCIFLIVIIFSKILYPFFMPDVFFNEFWSILLERSGKPLQALVFTGFIFHPSIIVIASFLLIMFFKRRHTFPRFFIAFLFTLALINGAYFLAVFLFLEADDFLSNQYSWWQVIDFVAIAYLIAYFKLSKRVQATFTKQLKTP